MRDSTRRAKRVAVFQTRFVAPDSHHDGSEAVMFDVLRHLGAKGVQTTLYCGQAADGERRFDLCPGVRVEAVLPFGAYRDPYRVQPIRLAGVIELLERAAAEHDVLHIQDNNLRFKQICRDIPTVASVFDLTYGHTLAGLLDFPGDRLIATSDYVGSCIREIFRGIRPLSSDALHVVNSGFDSMRFRPVPAAAFRARLGLGGDDIALLYPHRPDPSKGIHTSLAAIMALEHRLPPALYARIRLLVPKWADPRTSDEHQELYAALRERAADHGLAHKLVLHDWIPRRQMPAYYSAGAATLCVGTFPEALGNVHIESSMCGTPTIVSRVAAQRVSVPEELIRKVDPGDPEAVADHLAEILGHGARASHELDHFLREKFGLEQMLRGYEHALLDCVRGPDSMARAQREPLTESTTVRIPPWAARLRSGYYHDYLGYCADEQLNRSLSLVEAGRGAGEIIQRAGVTAADLYRWLRDGWVTTSPVVAAYPQALPERLIALPPRQSRTLPEVC
jgi:glycosyltransferase involved in cell wall biosynthesis